MVEGRRRATAWGLLAASALAGLIVLGSRNLADFDPALGGLSRDQVHVFGAAAGSFDVRGLFGFVVFHGLVWSSLLVVAGVLLALRRRLRDGGAAALQQFGEDFLPLLLLFAVSVTGLLLT